MSQEALQAFVERVNEDETFRDSLVAAGDNDVRLRIARDAGFDVTADDLVELRREHGVDELSEEDLQNIAGGMSHTGAGITITVTISGMLTIAAAFV